jgi:hypothetical protein
MKEVKQSFLLTFATRILSHLTLPFLPTVHEHKNSFRRFRFVLSTGWIFRYRYQSFSHSETFVIVVDTHLLCAFLKGQIPISFLFTLCVSKTMFVRES